MNHKNPEYRQELDEVKDLMLQTFGGQFSISTDAKSIYYFDEKGNGFMFLGLDHLKRWYDERLKQLKTREEANNGH